MFGPFVLLFGLGIAGFFLWVLRNADRQRMLKDLDRKGRAYRFSGADSSAHRLNAPLGVRFFFLTPIRASSRRGGFHQKGVSPWNNPSSALGWPAIPPA